MSDLSGYAYLRFPFGVQTGDQWRCLCPKCDNDKQKFFIHTDDGRSNCFHCGFRTSSWVGLIAQCEGLNGRAEIGKWIKEHESQLQAPHKFNKGVACRMPMRLDLPPHCVPVETYDPFYEYLRDREVTHDQIQQYRIHKCQEGKYQFRLIIPIMEGERLMYFFDRTVDPTETAKTLGIGSKKAYWPVEKSEVIFNLDSAAEHTAAGNPLRIAEGVFDALSLGPGAIALLGKSCSEAQMAKILNLNPPGVEVCLDADAAPQAIKLASRLANWGLTTYVRHFYNGDPNEYLINKWPLPRADAFSKQWAKQYLHDEINSREVVSFL